MPIKNTLVYVDCTAILTSVYGLKSTVNKVLNILKQKHLLLQNVDKICHYLSYEKRSNVKRKPSEHELTPGLQNKLK